MSIALKFNRILLTGMQDQELSHVERRSVYLMNSMSVLPAILAVLFCLPLYWTSGNTVTLYAPLSEALVLTVVPLLNKMHKHWVAATVLVLTHTIATFYWGCIIGELACVEFISVFLCLLVLCIYRDRRCIIVMTGLVLTMFCALKFNYAYHFFEPLPFSERGIIFARLSIQIAVVGLVLFVMWHALGYSDAVANDLRARNEDLQRKLKFTSRHFEEVEEEGYNLRQKIRMQDVNLKSVVHDMRGLMAPICAMLEQLKDNSTLESHKVVMSKSQLRGLDVCTRRMVSSINQILYREDNKKLENINLKFFCDDIMEIFSVAADISQIHLSYEFLGFPYVKVNPHYIDEFLTNTINNAITYASGLVDIKVKVGLDLLTIEVANDGKPLSKDVRNALLKADPENDILSANGKGIGIPTINRAIKNLNGQIFVEGGRTWPVCLVAKIPIQEGEVIEWEADAGYLDSSTAIDFTKKKILLVEDHQFQINFWGMYQQSLQFDLITASSLEKAIKIIESTADLDLIFLDINLDDSQGVDTVLKVQAATTKVPIIALTGTAEEDALVTLKEAGAIEVLQKPIFKPTLIEVIKKYHNI